MLQHLRQKHFGAGHFAPKHLSSSEPPPPGQVGDTFPLGWKSEYKHSTFALGWPSDVEPSEPVRRRGGARFRFIPSEAEQMLDDEDVIILAIKRFVEELII